MIGFSFLITKVSILSGSLKEGSDPEKQCVSFDLQLLPSDCFQSIHEEASLTLIETGNGLTHFDDFLILLTKMMFFFF